MGRYSFAALMVANLALWAGLLMLAAWIVGGGP
jgi:hypothetical protein